MITLFAQLPADDETGESRMKANLPLTKISEYGRQYVLFAHLYFWAGKKDEKSLCE